MILQTILFGDFTPPPILHTRKHRLDTYTVDVRDHPGTITRKIIDAIRQTQQGLSAREITDSIGAAYPTVMNTLVRLMARRQLRRVKHGPSYKYFME